MLLIQFNKAARQTVPIRGVSLSGENRVELPVRRVVVAAEDDPYVGPIVAPTAATFPLVLR